MRTVLVFLGTLGAGIVLTLPYGGLPLAIIEPGVAVLLTLHSSLQHEIIHGHPTRHARLNRLLGMVPLSFWLPFELYRQEHLQHHQDERLTDPLDDPESYYWTPSAWQRLSPVLRASFRLQQTLAGPVIIGSFCRIG